MQEGTVRRSHSNDDDDIEKNLESDAQHLAQALSARRRRDAEKKRRRLGLSVNSRDSVSAAKVRKPVARRHTGLDRFQHATGVVHTTPDVLEVNAATSTDPAGDKKPGENDKKPPGPLTTIPLVSPHLIHDARANPGANTLANARTKHSKNPPSRNSSASGSTSELDRKVDLLYHTGGLTSTSFSSFQKFEQSSRPLKSFEEREKARKMHAGIELAMRNRAKNSNQNRRKK
jgi:hypothetical protein